MECILFKLDNCEKCEKAEEYLRNVEHKSVTLPTNYYLWNDEQRSMSNRYKIKQDLAKTAPVFVADGEKHIGVLAIRRWARYEAEI